MTHLFAATAIALLVTSSGAQASWVQASWAICSDTITGAAITAKAELEAKQKALADWVTRASTLGVAYTRWQLAWNRQLACEPLGDGTVLCIARGRPCRISQTPPPPGSEMLKPGDRTP